MNILTAISEAMKSANEMERESDFILGLGRDANHSRANGYAPPYSALSRRRDRMKRAA